MKQVKIFCAVVVLFVLERVFFARYFEIFSLCPWLMFTFCLMTAAVSGELSQTAVIAGICGLLADISGGGAAGTAIAAFTVSVVPVYYFTTNLFRSSLPIALIAVFIFGTAGEMLYFSLNSGGVVNYSFLTALWSVALPLAAIDTVFALLMYPVVKRIFAERRYV